MRFPLVGVCHSETGKEVCLVSGTAKGAWPLDDTTGIVSEWTTVLD